MNDHSSQLIPIHNKKPITMMVACTNPDGQADIFTSSVLVTDVEFEHGFHRAWAKNKAQQAGFLGPYICYGPDQQKNIACQVKQLECPIPIELIDRDSINNSTVQGSIRFMPDGVAVKLDGYSDCYSIDDHGVIAFLEYWDNQVNLRAYADINCEEPSDVISFESAKNEHRQAS